MPRLMKGKVFADRKHLLQYPVIVEEKVDEVRVHAIRDPFVDGHIRWQSYDEKPLYNMEQFSPAMLGLINYWDLNELDLGLEVNHDFTDSKRWIRSSRGLPADLAGVFTRFLLFDAPDRADMPYRTRRDTLDAIANCARIRHGLNMVRPRFSIAQNEDEVGRAYSYFREDGCEGVMVKTFDHLYHPGKRIDGWLKWKPSLDADGIITGLIEAVSGKDQPDKGIRVGDKLGRVGSVILRMDDGSTATPHGIAHDLGRDMLRYPEKYLGERCEFQYMERDTQGGYRHPTYHRIRE